jgi:hypothetical protein
VTLIELGQGINEQVVEILTTAGETTGDINSDDLTVGHKLVSYDLLTLKLERLALWMKQNRKHIK